MSLLSLSKYRCLTEITPAVQRIDSYYLFVHLIILFLFSYAQRTIAQNFPTLRGLGNNILNRWTWYETCRRLPFYMLIS